jgi:hypothetical protein
MDGEGRERLAAWTFAALLALATLPLLPALGLWTAVMRYEVDVVAAWVLRHRVFAVRLRRGGSRWAADQFAAPYVVAVAVWSVARLS